jgi:SAM-dependent methyltransferase
MIVAVEGASAVGKTTWCAQHARENMVPEALGLLAAIGHDRPLERCEHWQRVNDRRWQAALALERGSGVAVCDTDPFKLHYVWTLWQIGEAPEGEWQYAAGLARESFAARRCGVADVVAIGRMDPRELLNRKESDRSRSRRRFELHARLAEPLRHWYDAIDSLERGRVVWELPPRGLADPRLQVRPRAIHDGGELFDALMRELAARSRPSPPRNEAAWYARTAALLEAAYLRASDPYGGSGKSGGAHAWELARRVIAVAIDRGGSFLDVGCANGLLLESLTAWCAAGGHAIEPHGLELSELIAALARSRLPRWADRIVVGNALTWTPAMRFDFVRTELVYVPDHRRPELVERLLRDVVAPGGRLIVCGYGSGGRRPEVGTQDVATILRGWGHRVTGEAYARDEAGRVITRVAWIDVSRAERGRQ